MDDEERHSVAVAAVVLDRHGQVLLVRRRDHGNWEPPGGALKVGESIEEALLREVEEETSLRISIERLTGVYENPVHGVLSLVFRCTPRSGHAEPGEETAEVAWVETASAGQRLSPGYAQWIIDSLEPGTVAIRLQPDTVMGASSSPASPLSGDDP